ncbi:MAG: 4a-hydroxytetrahydrobiopterin dehydratase [Ignavibacteria bacterium]|nr:4a-hydroxytetrahydrobiopterin dehydratase [Ignavibacteria bacterium]
MKKLTDTQIKEALKTLTNWKYRNNKIQKIFTTTAFPQTMGLVTAIGAFCQQHDHHPDYLTMKYSSVEVSFSTHTAKGITKKDIDIAKDIDTLNF